jgi:2-amino-4-hydroxy-6-hydroxymethyldihydropteridine diphosphokinase
VNEIIHIGLGSNLGDREQNLLSAVEAITHIDAVAVLCRSSLYESAPIGPAQGRFLNAAVSLECALEPSRLLVILKQIEQDLGREPTVRWGPRTIDLDILLWGNRVVAEPHLQIPHVGLHNRRFALEPLVEIDPDAWHPILKVHAREMLAKLAPQDVVRYEAVRWPRPEFSSDP